MRTAAKRQGERMKAQPTRETQKPAGDLPLAEDPCEGMEWITDADQLMRWLRHDVQAYLLAMDRKLDKVSSKLDGFYDLWAAAAPATPHAKAIRANRTSLVLSGRRPNVPASAAYGDPWENQEMAVPTCRTSIRLRPEGWPEPASGSQTPVSGMSAGQRRMSRLFRAQAAPWRGTHSVRSGSSTSPHGATTMHALSDGEESRVSTHSWQSALRPRPGPLRSGSFSSADASIMSYELGPRLSPRVDGALASDRSHGGTRHHDSSVRFEPGKAVDRMSSLNSLTSLPEASHDTTTTFFSSTAVGAQAGTGSHEKDKTAATERAPSRAAFSSATEVTEYDYVNSSMSFNEFKSVRRGRRLSWKGELLWNTLEDPDSSIFAQVYDKVMPFLIMASVIVPVLQTIRPIAPLKGSVAALLESVFEFVFAAEIVLRFLVRYNIWQFLANSYNLIDMLSCLPIVVRVPVYAVNGTFELLQDQRENPVGLFLLCVVPVLRLLKTLRRFEKFHLLLRAVEIAFEALPILIFVFVVLTLLFSSVIYLVEPRANVESLPNAMWLTIVTMTTVGYGDVVPQTTEGCLIVGVLVVCSVLYMAMPIGIIGQAFTEVWGDRYRILLARRTANRLLAWGYTAQDIPLLFRSFDADGNGELDLEEFRMMIKQMRVGLSDRNVIEIFERFDCDGSGTIDDAEFMRALFPSKYHEIYGAKQLRSLDQYEEEADDNTVHHTRDVRNSPNDKDAVREEPFSYTYSATSVRSMKSTKTDGLEHITSLSTGASSRKLTAIKEGRRTQEAAEEKQSKDQTIEDCQRDNTDSTRDDTRENTRENSS